MTDEDTYSKYIDKLIDRLNNVRDALDSEDINYIQNELDFCQSFLQNIRIQAEMQDIDLSCFDDEFDKVREISYEIEEEIDRINNPLWKRIVRGIISTINTVLGILQIPFRLPTPVKLLTAGND